MKYQFKFIKDNQTLLEKQLAQGTYVIGSQKDCDIVIDSKAVMKKHIELRITPTAVYCLNLSIESEIILDGKKIETGELKHGNELEFGDVTLLVHDPGQADQNFLGSSSHNHNPSPGQFDISMSHDRKEPSIQFGGGEFQQNAAIKQQVSAPVLEKGSAAQKDEDTFVEQLPIIAKVIFTEGPKKGQEINIESFEATLGRSRQADIHIPDDKLSRIHAKIARVGLGYRLVDLNSRNGTYVNGMRVIEHPLSSFDKIKMGRSEITFLVHDSVNENAGGAFAIQAMNREDTHSVILNKNDAHAAAISSGKLSHKVVAKLSQYRLGRKYLGLSKLGKALVVTLSLLVLVFLLSPSSDKSAKKDPAKVVATDKSRDSSTQHIVPSMPQEYYQLSPEQQRSLEGFYQSSIRAAEQGEFALAVGQIKKVHELVPFYKKSRDILPVYEKRLKEQQVLEAEQKARNDEKEDLAIYLEDGKHYLGLGDFERAGEAFNSALAISPNSQEAKNGLRAAELKVKDMNNLPPEVDPNQEKTQKVIALFEKSMAAFKQKRYTEAIEHAEKIRLIEIPGDTRYLNEAKQIIDKAQILQKEEFEPFIIQAKEKFAEGDYNSSRDLCEEMVKRDVNYKEAQTCLLRAKKQLNRLAKEAYVHGYILESMNKINEAKQYWNRARSYVRPGDEYYKKVIKKLEKYD